MRFTHYLGVDLGQARDFTALALLEEAVWVREEALATLVLDRAGWYAPDQLSRYQLDQARAWAAHYGRPDAPPLSIRWLERAPLGTSYPKIVERVGQLLGTPPLRAETTALVVDETGVGRPVCDLFRHAGLPNLVPVTITGGTAVAYDPSDNSYRVPKRDLVASAQVLLQNRALRIARGLPETATLLRELETFKLTINLSTAHDSYGAWRERDHDDVLLAACLATWFRTWWNVAVDHAARQWRISPEDAEPAPAADTAATAS